MPRSKNLNPRYSQMQEVAFSQEEYSINSHTFNCYESYHMGQLLNGVSLQLSETKGLSNNPKAVDYMPDTQEIVFQAGGNIVAYNTAKRNYHLLLSVDGEIIIMKSHSEKMNNKQYLLWVENISLASKQTKSEDDENKKQQIKPSGFKDLHGRKNNPKKTDFNLDKSMNEQSPSNDPLLSMNIFSQLGPFTQGGSVNKRKGVTFSMANQVVHLLKIYDYTKKQLIFAQKIKIPKDYQLIDLFCFFNSYKMVGYVVEKQNSNTCQIYYLNCNQYSLSEEYKKKTLIRPSEKNCQGLESLMGKKRGTSSNGRQRPRRLSVLQAMPFAPFARLVTEMNIRELKYNAEQCYFIFTHQAKLYSLSMTDEDSIKKNHQITIDSGSQRFEKVIKSPLQFLMGKLSAQVEVEGSEGNRNENIGDGMKKLEYLQGNEEMGLQIKEISAYNEPVLCIAINQFYLAILTKSILFIYSIFDGANLLQELTLQRVVQQEGIVENPSYIQFNKSNLLMTWKNTPKIATFILKKKEIVYSHTTEVEINHCKEILKIFTNPITTEIVCISRLYELEGRMSNIIKSKKIVQTCLQYVQKPACIDLSSTHLTSATKCEGINFGLNCQKFINIHICPWLSTYLYETESEIQYSLWKQSFQNKKCSALHPTGLYLAIGFKDSFKVYAVTQEGLINTFRGDSLRQIQSLSISHDGSRLAVGTSNSIAIYLFDTCKRIKMINLALGAQLEKIQFLQKQLMYVLRSKKVYLLDYAHQYKEVGSYNLKALTQEVITEEQSLFTNLLSAVVTQTINFYDEVYSCIEFWYDEEREIILISTRGILFFYNCVTNSMLCQFQFQPITCFYFCKNLSTLFMGTAKGELFSFIWPNKPTNLLFPPKKEKFHRNKVTHIKVTSDMKHLVSISQDQSIYISNLTYIRNLKKMTGLQIVQYEGNSKLHLNYSFLERKGLALYSNFQMSQKQDLIQDFQEEVLNLNFILPEERIKQRQQMLSNVDKDTIGMQKDNQKLYRRFNQQSSDARNMVNSQKEELELYRKEIKQSYLKAQDQLMKEYMIHYHQSCQSELKKKELKECLLIKKNQQKQNCLKIYTKLKDQQALHLQMLEKNCNETRARLKKQTPAFEELDLIQEEKKQYLGRSIKELNDELARLNESNGVFLCKNNNTLVQIEKYKQKLDQNSFMISRVQISAERMLEKNQKNKSSRERTIQNFSEEDKANLASIEKRYIQQTQVLIEKDKQIGNKIVLYEKEKGILVHLEKAVEAIEKRIDELVENYLMEKEVNKAENTIMEQFKKKIDSLLLQFNEQKKLKLKSRKAINKVGVDLHILVQDIFSKHSKPIHEVIKFLNERSLIDKIADANNRSDARNRLALDQENIEKAFAKGKLQNEEGKNRKGRNRQRQTFVQEIDCSTEDLKIETKNKGQMLNSLGRNRWNKIFTEQSEAPLTKDQRLSTITFTPLNSSQNQRVRKDNTEIPKNYTLRNFHIRQKELFSQRKNEQSSSNPFELNNPVSQQSKQIYSKISLEEKQYMQLKGQQVIYQNSKKMFTLQNQDLLNTYNNLYHTNKILKIKMHQQELSEQNFLQTKTKKSSKKIPIQNSLTPFLEYRNMNGNKKSLFKTLPSQTYEF